MIARDSVCQREIKTERQRKDWKRKGKRKRGIWAPNTASRLTQASRGVFIVICRVNNP